MTRYKFNKRLNEASMEERIYTVSIPYYVSDSYVDLEEDGRYKTYQSALQNAKQYVEDYYDDNTLFIYDYVNNITYSYDRIDGWQQILGIDIDDSEYDIDWEEYLGCCVLDSIRINESRKYRRMRRLNEASMEERMERNINKLENSIHLRLSKSNMVPIYIGNGYQVNALYIKDDDIMVVYTNNQLDGIAELTDFYVMSDTSMTYEDFLRYINDSI